MITMDMLEEQTNKARFTLEDKTIAIGGEPGCGKTALIHELFKILEKETGNPYIATNCVFENRYAMYDGYKKIVPPLKDYYNDDFTLRTEVIDDKPLYIQNYAHLLDYTKMMIKTKAENKDFPVKIICFDPLSITEKLVNDHMIQLEYENTGVWTTREKYKKGRGRIYTESLDTFRREIKKPLEAIGYKVWFVFHVKDKKFDDPILGEYDTFTSENTSSFFREMFKDVDYSILFESTATINNKRLEQGQRIIRWRDGNNYKGAKATGETFPETQNVHGMSDAEIAQLVYDTIMKELKHKAGVKDEEFDKVVKVQREENKEKETKVLGKIAEISKKSEEKNIEKEKRQKVADKMKWILKQNIPQENIDAFRGQFQQWYTQFEVSNAVDLLSKVDVDTANMIINSMNEWLGGLEGYVKLENL